MDQEINRLLSFARETNNHSRKANTSSSYNIFNVLGVSRKEVIMTRFLYDMLNPNGSHGSGDRYLRLFFEIVLHKEYVLKNYIVSTEYSIRNNNTEEADSFDCNIGAKTDASKRIDIVITGEKTFIPIEVKIDADDQPNQCCDYLRHAEAMGGDCLYYLTIDGRKPTAKSIGTLTDIEKKKIKQISFISNINEWLDAVIARETDVELRYMFIKYADAIGGFIGIMNFEEKKELAEEQILKSPDSLRAALCIETAVKYAKAELLRKTFEAIYDALKQKYKTLTRLDSKKFTDSIDQYYDKGGKPYMEFQTKTGHKFRIEVEWRLWIGVQINDKKRYDWVYLPSGTQSETDAYDFYNMNDAVLSLTDENTRGKFVSEVYNSATRFLAERGYE